MSSSEYIRRLSLVDLQQEAPPPLTPDFSIHSEFPRTEIGRSTEATPEEAYRNGLAEGEERGRAAALKEIGPVLEELRSVTSSMASVRHQRLADVEDELAQVAARAARRILHGELEQADDIVLRMARACTEEAKDEGSLVLHVAPADAELIRTHVPELELDLADGAIQIQPDPLIQAGSVVLETPIRCYDGRPERILENAVQQLRAQEES
jgi:flagellar biosynthesis/type III secretory pathway protein FliH